MTILYDTEDSIVALRVDVQLPVDDLTNPIWENASETKIERYWSGEAAPAERHARVRFCWSTDALYTRFVCTQREPLVVSPSPVTNKKTLGLWDRDVCEIFIAPDIENPSCYFEFEAAPTGEWVDLGIRVTSSGRETEWDFKSGMQVATSSHNDLIVVGIRIPWSERIPRPSQGDEWRVNLFRCVGPESETRYLAWRPTRTEEPNFHVPEVFGRLVFG